MFPAGVPGIVARRETVAPGLTLRVLESGPADGPVALLVHGWGGSVYTFDATIPALAASGHRVLALDLPGHGLSDKPTDAARYRLPALVDAVLAVLSASRAEPYAVVAHSMGGAIALEIARRDARVRRLALLGAVGAGRVPLAPVLRWLTPPWAATVIAPLLTRTVIDRVLELAFGTDRRPVARDVAEYWAPTQFNAFSLALRACLHEMTWSRLPTERLAAIGIPVLVVVGGRDRVVRDVASGGRLIPGARVLELPEAGHLVVQECADAVNRELVAFLSS